MKISKNFVLFRLPGENKFKLWTLKDEQDSVYFIFHSFDNKTTRRLYKKEEIVLKYEELTSLNFDLKLTKRASSITEPSHDDYIKKCKLFINALKNNQLDKVILSRRKFTAPPKDYANKMLNLANKYPKAMVYLVNFDGLTWMGASPEKLIQIENNVLTTVALASTKAISDQRDWTEKEYKEHELVVDYIHESLREFDPIRETTETVSVGEIQHLKTKFSAHLKSTIPPEEVCNLLHPTPAVCGIPKDKAHSFILENEGYDRSFYTGYFGFISPEATQVYVNLRCAELFKDNMVIYVGGGILPESDPEKEWIETEWKAKALLS